MHELYFVSINCALISFLDSALWITAQIGHYFGNEGTLWIFFLKHSILGQSSRNLTRKTTVTGSLFGLKPGLHGFHWLLYFLHHLSLGPHFNPVGKDHGALEDEEYHHVGDLGNVIVGEDGTVNFKIVDKQIHFTRSNSIVGRVVVVNADPDDLGKGKP
ncbi:hypothetical protein AAG906_013169 [Vitis piasezkii]